MTERSGTVVFRLGKGSKQRTVPPPFAARRAMQAYLDCGRPRRQAACSSENGGR
jgi:site-specific recombinase XerD